MKIIRRLLWRSPPPIPPEWLAFELAALRSQLDFQMKCLKILDQRMMIMQTALDALRDEVAGLTDVPASIDAAFAGMKKQLADAIAGAGDPAAVNAIVADLHAKADAIKAAITTNTVGVLGSPNPNFP